MSSLNKVVDISKAQKPVSFVATKNEAVELALKKHDSLRELVTYHTDVLEDLSDKVFAILQADEIVNKNLTAFLYLVATGNEKSAQDFESLELGSAGIVSGDLFQQVADSLTGYKKIDAMKLCIADHNGELKTSEVKDVKSIMHTYKIGTAFKQQTISDTATKKPPSNVVSIF